ncbi:hypothetical protein [Xanthocytophaga agilis]|uniref:Uncharacterized protein n=1 Tax=Xanthocytophaga agilis TaxID=3048010 RepID=A0AAE3RA26_9BACT|nr:hypothetical protein [Xanthocytophaga agilis]MDJ1503498.1 hypothetical protein [Xanthocytophaga agilis]
MENQVEIDTVTVPIRKIERLDNAIIDSLIQINQSKILIANFWDGMSQEQFVTIGEKDQLNPIYGNAPEYISFTYEIDNNRFDGVGIFDEKLRLVEIKLSIMNRNQNEDKISMANIDNIIRLLTQKYGKSIKTENHIIRYSLTHLWKSKKKKIILTEDHSLSMKNDTRNGSKIFMVSISYTGELAEHQAKRAKNEQDKKIPEILKKL